MLLSDMDTHYICRGLPALTIHTIVKQTKKAFVNVQNPKLKAWGPTLSGLAVVPALPYLYDHPVEVATDRAFDWIKEKMAETGTRTGKEDKEL